MEYRQIGHSQLYASKMGLGCMSLKPNQSESEYIIHKALDNGINYFDTADLYDFGENEQLVGKALQGKRNDVIIASKVGNQWNSMKDGWSWNPTKKYIKQAVKASLKRLKTDYIDLYQLHGGTINDPIDETIEAFEELVNEGVIRYYGISSIRPNVIKEYVNKSNLISVMMQHSLLDRRPEEEILSLLDSNNISVISRGPLAKGLLTELFSKKLSSSYLDYHEEDLQVIIPKLKQWANEHQYQLHELALHYNLAHLPIATVVPGVSSLQQLEINLSAIHKQPLSEADISEIQKIVRANFYDDHR